MLNTGDGGLWRNVWRQRLQQTTTGTAVEKLVSQALQAIALDALGVFSAVKTAIFDSARGGAAGAIRVHSVEPPCSTDVKAI